MSWVLLAYVRAVILKGSGGKRLVSEPQNWTLNLLSHGNLPAFHPETDVQFPHLDRRSLYLMYVYAVSQCAKSPILLTINWHKRANPLSFQKQWMVNRSAPGKTTWSSYIQSDSRPHQMSGKDSTTQRRILFHEENAIPFFSSYFIFFKLRFIPEPMHWTANL